MKWFKHRLNFDDRPASNESSDVLATSFKKREPQIVRATFRSNNDFDSGNEDVITPSVLPPIRIRSSIQHQKISLPPKKRNPAPGIPSFQSAPTISEERAFLKPELPKHICEFIVQNHLRRSKEYTHRTTDTQILENGVFKVYHEEVISTVETSSHQRKYFQHNDKKNEFEKINKENDIRTFNQAVNQNLGNTSFEKGNQHRSKKNAFLYQVASPIEMPHLKPWNNTVDKEILKQSISTPLLVQSTFEFPKIEDQHTVQQSIDFDTRRQNPPPQQQILIRSKSEDTGLNQGEKTERPKNTNSATLNLFSLKSKKDIMTKSSAESSLKLEENLNQASEQNIVQTKELSVKKEKEVKVKKIRVLKQSKIKSPKTKENNFENNSTITIKNPRAMQNEPSDINANSSLTNVISQVEVVDVHSLKNPQSTEKPSRNKFKKRTNVLHSVKMEGNSSIKFNENDIQSDQSEMPIKNIPEPSKREHTLPVPKKRSIVNIPKEELERIEIPIEIESIVKNPPSAEQIPLPSSSSTNENDTWNFVARHRQNTRAMAVARATAKPNYQNFYNAENEHGQMDADEISDDIIILPETKSDKPKTMREMKQFNMNNRVKNEAEHKEIKLEDRRRSEESDTEA